MATKLRSLLTGKTQLHIVSKDVARITQGPPWRRRISYWLRGYYGHILVGIPTLEPRIASAIASLGGVSRLLPTSDECSAKAGRWFQKFGSEIVFPLGLAGGQHPLPARPADDAAIVGVSFHGAEKTGRNFHWRFQWRDKTVSSPALAQQGDIVLDPRNYRSEGHHYENRSDEGQELRSTDTLARLSAIEPRLILHAHNPTRH